MSIWMDMTYSLSVWKGGLVGIIRAELELAKNLHLINKDIRFCRATNTGFIEIKPGELDWLWNSDKAGDAYLKYMGRDKKELSIKPINSELPKGLQKAYEYSEGRLDRIKMLRDMLISRSPKLLSPVVSSCLYLLYLPLKIASMSRQLVLHGRLEDNPNKPNKIENIKNEVPTLKTYPFSSNDIFFAAGWYSYEGIIKEKFISEIKNKLPNMTIVYLVYDLVLSNPNTSPLYDGKIAFERYLMWINSNCDYILYGGNTAREDAEKFYKKNGFPIRKSDFLKFGSDVSKENINIKFDVLKEKYKIEDNYILSVGTVDAKKNYSTLYHAYTMMSDKYGKENIPQLVIVGGKYGDPALSEAMEIDPVIKDKIVFTRPSDDELIALYQNCRFTVLPTWYEGWSLTLPESLLHGKFCLSSNVAPLREIAGDMVEYVDPDNSRMWADKIMYYFNNSNIVEEYNTRIKKEYKPISWLDCAKDLNLKLNNINESIGDYTDSHIIYDLSLAFHSAQSGASVSGILRTQLILARLLGRYFPHIRFGVLLEDKCIFIDRFALTDLFLEQSIDQSYSLICPVMVYLNRFLNSKIKKRDTQIYTNGQIFWMFASIFPEKIRDTIIKQGLKYKDEELNKVSKVSAYKLPFKRNDIFFSAGVGYSTAVYNTLEIEKKRLGFKFIQLIYDFTPILYPQVHTKETRKFYPNFLKFSYDNCDEIFYGGETAMQDGIIYARNEKLPLVKSFPIKFGSDITVKIVEDKEKIKKDLFERIKIKGRYIMAVGSIEARKNHETLYLAYLSMLKEHEDDIPQMIFCGYPGWKTEEFIKRLYRDERVRNKIIIYTPSDVEMDILYKNCDFTVLASLYEGWSLTLPESLNYNKLCITTDAAPMREIGGDLLEYVSAFDVKEWANKIWKYYNDKKLLEEKEENIRKNWKPISWRACAEQTAKELERLYKEGV